MTPLDVTNVELILHNYLSSHSDASSKSHIISDRSSFVCSVTLRGSIPEQDQDAQREFNCSATLEDIVNFEHSSKRVSKNY